MSTKIPAGLFFAMAILAPSLAAPQAFVAPRVLQDSLWESLVGNWEGWSESSLGRFDDDVEIEWGLQRQFLIIRVTSKTDKVTYKTTGYCTMDSTTGKITGYWFDTLRRVLHSTEVREGNKFTIRWEGGAAATERTYEKMSKDKWVGSFRDVDASGKPVEGRCVLLRQTKSSKKAAALKKL